MIVKKLLMLITSIKNLIIISIFIFFQKKLGKKIVIFYHSKENLKRISEYYINRLLNIKDKKICVLTLDNDLNNFFFSVSFIQEKYLNFLIGIDIFFNNYLCDTFPKNCLKIYIHHDIYDTPLANKKIENTIKKRLTKYNYILLPSIKSKKVFDNLNINFKKRKIKIEYIGYYKLDLLYYSKIIENNSNIIIAPTNILSFPSMTLMKNIYEIIDGIIKNSKFNVIFRPHPANLSSLKIENLKKKYENNARFIFDGSKNYLKTYSNSRFLITDLSGTAYTYSFLTNNPVIFFSNYEKKLAFHGYANLNYFKDRKKIGFIVASVHSILKIILAKNLNPNININREKIKSLFLVGLAKKRFNKFLKKII